MNSYNSKRETHAIINPVMKYSTGLRVEVRILCKPGQGWMSLVTVLFSSIDVVFLKEDSPDAIVLIPTNAGASKGSLLSD